jgi:hypothetical protein
VDKSCGALLDEACPKAKVEPIEIRRESRNHFFMRESSVKWVVTWWQDTGT